MEENRTDGKVELSISKVETLSSPAIMFSECQKPGLCISFFLSLW